MVEEALSESFRLPDQSVRFEPSDCAITLEFVLRSLKSVGRRRALEIGAVIGEIREVLPLESFGVVDDSNIFRYGQYEVSLMENPGRTKLTIKFTKYTSRDPTKREIPTKKDMLDVYIFYSLFGKRLLENTGYCFDDFETRFDMNHDDDRISHRSKDWDEHMNLCTLLAHFKEFEEAARANWDEKKEEHYRGEYYQVLGKIHDYEE